MEEITDWVRNLDAAISNMSRHRRIIYFKSENRHVIEDAVNVSLALWDKIGLSAPHTPNCYETLVKNYKCFLLAELYQPGGILGKIQFKTARKGSSGEKFALIPRVLVLSDFQVFKETDRSGMIKAFLDNKELSDALLLISSPQLLIPDGFSGEIELILDSFLSKRDLFLKLREQVEEEGTRDGLSDEELMHYAESFVGLTGEQAANVLEGMEGELSRGLRTGMHLRLILKEKQTEASKDAAIRFLEVSGEETVAGLGHFTSWLSERAVDFADPNQARLQGTPAPKGVLLCGVPGTGKTAMARETARILNVPLIQFDISRIQGSRLGESESRLRRYLDRISAFGSCVMLMDEIEKTFRVNDSTHEVKLAMLGLLLDWMQTRTANVLTFITANDITMLPSELLRDGRISGRFFAFMPMREDLTAILRLKLKQLMGRGIFNREFLEVLQSPGGMGDPLAEIFDSIAKDAMEDEEQGISRAPFFTGANLESLIEITNRTLRREVAYSQPYSLDAYTAVMRKAARDFVPQGQSNMQDLVQMWLKAQQRKYQDVSDHTVLPFNRFKDGHFVHLTRPENSYDCLFQETLQREIERSYEWMK